MTNGNTRFILMKESGMERSSTPEYMESGSPHSPTDSSEDSVEVKVEVISGRSKRKLNEPRRINDSSGPLKKRMCVREEAAPFRPWNTSSPHLSQATVKPESPIKQYFRPPTPIRPTTPELPVDLIKKEIRVKEEDVRVPCHETDVLMAASLSVFPKLNETEKEESLHRFDGQTQLILQQRKEQRNYKNMTRERRIEANARERTRVHTISAAFDTLRKSVPAYSHSQKLSKLSVLRIACSYIATLANILDESPEIPDNVESVSRTIQKEGKLRKKKDDD